MGSADCGVSMAGPSEGPSVFRLGRRSTGSARAAGLPMAATALASCALSICATTVEWPPAGARVWRPRRQRGAGVGAAARVLASMAAGAGEAGAAGRWLARCGRLRHAEARCTNAPGQKLRSPGVAFGRQAQPIPFRDLPVPLHTAGRRPGLSRAALALDLERALERARCGLRGQLHFLELHFVRALQVAEVLFRVAVDLERREERDVEIAGGEAERRALVVAARS